MACATNINNFVNGSVTCNVNGTNRTYSILNLAKWVSYQSDWYIAAGIPVALILAHWGFEMGWSLTEFTNRWNPANQYGLCGYSGSIDTSKPSGKGTSFTNVVEGVTAYGHLLIAGYKHIAWCYSDGSGGNTGLQKAINGLNNGYDTGYSYGSTSYCSSKTYLLNSSSEKRLWAEAGYTGMYNTITSSTNTCLNDKVYRQTTDPGLTGFDGINFTD